MVPMVPIGSIIFWATALNPVLSRICGNPEKWDCLPEMDPRFRGDDREKNFDEAATSRTMPE